jgi:acyl dehydratase
MKQKKVVFGDSEIVEFCRTTLDTNEIHDPAYMAKLGKRVIVPGLFVLSQTASLSVDFLKNHACSLKVLFNSLLSSGDVVTLRSSSSKGNPSEVRLSAINRTDTMTLKDDYTRLSVKETRFKSDHQGILRRLEVTKEQIEKFKRLIGTEDRDVANFLFAVSYASHASLMSIEKPETEIEIEIKETISKDPGISPFYHSIEIHIPSPFPVFNPVGELDYFIHFEREKPFKVYGVYVRCEHHGYLVFNAYYNLLGIDCGLILRMAKAIKENSAE